MHPWGALSTGGGGVSQAKAARLTAAALNTTAALVEAAVAMAVTDLEHLWPVSRCTCSSRPTRDVLIARGDAILSILSPCSQKAMVAYLFGKHLNGPETGLVAAALMAVVPGGWGGRAWSCWCCCFSVPGVRLGSGGLGPDAGPGSGDEEQVL